MNIDPVINITIDRSQHTVLVVDDNPTTRYATARVVRAAGFQTQEAGTGGEAVRLAPKNISAVVLDVHLPDFIVIPVGMPGLLMWLLSVHVSPQQTRTPVDPAVLTRRAPA